MAFSAEFVHCVADRLDLVAVGGVAVCLGIV